MQQTQAKAIFSRRKFLSNKMAMKFWGAEVKPGKSLKLNLSDDQTLRVTQVGRRRSGGNRLLIGIFLVFFL